MVIDSSSEGFFKRFIPKHEASSAWLWIFQRISGALVFFLLLFHMAVNHYLNLVIPEDIATEYGIASMQSVIIKMQNPAYFIVSILFVVVLLFHALNGFRTVVLDLAPSQNTRKLLGILLILIGIVATIYILILNLMVASFQIPT
jgi:succinate dehydrogenase cytochrome b556 subunit